MPLACTALCYVVIVNGRCYIVQILDRILRP